MRLYESNDARQRDASDFAELYTPKLLTVLREGYGLPHLRADAIAGLTVAIVALPLSMAIAIASGMAPAQGLYTAIVGGSSSPCLAARASRSADPPEPSSSWWPRPWRSMALTA